MGVGFKIFFKSLGKFVLWAAIPFLVLCMLNRYITVVNQEKIFAQMRSQALGSDILVFGDSHANSSIDDAMITNSVNFGKDSERMLYSLAKLKIIEQQLDRKTVIFVLGYHSMLNRDPTPYKTESSISNYEVFAPFLSVDRESYNEWWTIGSKKTLITSYSSIPSTQMIRELLSVVRRQSPDLYGYAPSDKIIDYRSIEANSMRHYGNLSNGTFYDKDICYFKQFLALCKTHNCSVVLLMTPVHKEYFNRIPKSIVNQMDSLLAATVNNENIRVMNLTSHNFPDSCMRDADHVNRYGSKLLTSMVRDSLELSNRITLNTKKEVR